MRGEFVVMVEQGDPFPGGQFECGIGGGGDVAVFLAEGVGALLRMKTWKA